LEIGLHDHQWTERLVALDPLYLVEPNLNLIDDSIKQFTPEYQRRVRPYHLRDINFRTLPQEQIGFAFSWNYLNYKSLDTVKQWLQEVFKVLRPGGVFMFSYNNADIPSGAGFAETFWMSYMPKSTLVPLCEMLGYEVIASYDFNQSACWIELKKPGTLHTVKAHQALGELKPVEESAPEPEPITDAEMSSASVQELERKELYELRRLANELKIDTPDKIRYGYTLEKLRTILKDKKSS
jgi:SAM-dependent methyltransferase